MKKLIITLALLFAPLAFSEKVSLSWNDNSDNEVGFEVERKLIDGEFTQIASVKENETAYVDDTALPGKTYVYRVRAFNFFGVSGYSNEATAEIKQDKYFQPFEPGEDPSGLGGQQIVANLTINAQNVTVNQIASNDAP